MNVDARPHVFGGPKDGRPVVGDGGGRRDDVFGGPKDGRPVVEGATDHSTNSHGIGDAIAGVAHGVGNAAKSVLGGIGDALSAVARIAKSVATTKNDHV